MVTAVETLPFARPLTRRDLAGLVDETRGDDAYDAGLPFPVRLVPSALRD